MAAKANQPKKSRVFYNAKGYVEINFVGIVYTTAIHQIMTELSQLIATHGPIGVLLDGRYGRLQHDAGTLIALSESNPMPKLTHMIVLTSKSENRRDVIVQNPKGIVTEISALAVTAPIQYVSNETEARRLAANKQGK